MTQNNSDTDISAGVHLSYSFLAVFAVLFITIAHYLSNIIPEAVITGMIDTTGKMSATLLRSLGFAAVFNYPHIIMSGFTMEVNIECTAVDFMAIYSAGVLVYPWHRWHRKVVGLAGGLAIIIFLNVARIGTVGMIGEYSTAFSGFVHDYLWQGTFAFMVMALWIAWARGLSLFDRPVMRFAVIFFIAAGLSIFTLDLIMEPYAQTLAVVADELFRIIPGVPNVSVSTYAMYGSNIIYFDGHHAYKYFVATDILNSAIFLALMTASHHRYRAWTFVGNTLAGYGVLIALQLFYIMAIGIGFSLVPDTLLKHSFFAVRGISMISPFLIWLAITKACPQVRN